MVSILLVDDQPTNLFALEVALRNPEYELIKAESGEEALHILETKVFALVLMDVQMPGIDGFETTKIIKESPKLRATPVVFVSSTFDDEIMIDKALSIGASDYLLKPFKLEALKAKVALYVELFKNKYINQQRALENERDNFINLFRQTPEMVCILKGPEHVFEFVNEAHVKVLGFDATGMAVRKAQPESVEVHGILDNVYNTGITAELNEIPVTVTDRLRYFNLTYSARRNVNGEINGVMILGLEVTALIESRLAYKKSQEQLSFALKGSNMGVWSVNLETGKVDLSQEAATIFDAFEEFGSADLAIDAFIHPEDREHARQTLMDTLAQNKMYQDEYRVLKKDGTISWVSLRGKAIVENNIPKLLTGVVMDVTSRKNQEIELQKAISLRDDFISIASHELRTPITTLSLQNQMLMRVMEKSGTDQVDSSKVKKVVDTSQIQLKHLIRLVDDMLDVSKISTGKINLHLESVNLSKLLLENIERLSPLLFEKHIDVKINVDQEILVNADPLRMDQIMTNLLSNAIKYGENKPISVTLKKVDKMAELTISDQGIGIAEHKLPKIFDRFERAISAKNISGLGLGLFIVKELVEAQGGTIEVASQLGEGSQFVVRIPL